MLQHMRASDANCLKPTLSSRMQVVNEDRKQRQLTEKQRNLQRDVDSRTMHLESMKQRLEQTEQQMQEERSRANGMRNASEMADQLAELDQLTELQYGLEVRPLLAPDETVILLTSPLHAY